MAGSLESMLAAKGAPASTMRLAGDDEAERGSGAPLGRPRVKLTALGGASSTGPR